MDITFICPECKWPLTCDEKGVGLKIPCPHCKALITVPPTKPPASTPPPQKAQVRIVGDRGLEGWLQYGGVSLLVLLVIAVLLLVGAYMAGALNIYHLILVVNIIGLLVLGVVLFFFFSWMAEMLAAAKKSAGLTYDNIFTKAQAGFECTACQKIMTERVELCPQCKCQLIWPIKLVV